jgi:hypothetical protein
LKKGNLLGKDLFSYHQSCFLDDASSSHLNNGRTSPAFAQTIQEGDNEKSNSTNQDRGLLGQRCGVLLIDGVLRNALLTYEKENVLIDHQAEELWTSYAEAREWIEIPNPLL